MPDSSPYHLGELELLSDLSNPLRAVPSYDSRGWTILDIGCGMGQTLTAVEFGHCSARHGIDVDAKAIALGRQRFPEFTLSVAGAEQIPYPDNTFDLTFSRVALPYTDVPVALREMFRVTKPGGRVWLTLHDWSMERVQIKNALRDRNPRRLADRCYVLVNSMVLALFGVCLRRPGSGTVESIQSERGIRRLLRKAGFADIELTHAVHFLVAGVKPRI